MKNFLKTFLFALAGLTLLQGAERPWSLVDLDVNSRFSREEKTLLEKSDFSARSPWHVTRTVHGGHPEKEKILSLCTSLRKGGTLLIRIDKAVSSYKSRSGAVQMVTSGVTRSIPLPAGAAGKTISAKFKSAVKGALTTMVIFRKNKKTLRSVRGLSAAVPAGADNVIFIYRLQGAGELLLQEASVSLENRKMDEDIICFPMDYLDRKFYLPEKGTHPIFFSFKRQYGQRRKDVKLHLHLPRGVRVTGADGTVRRIAQDVIDVRGAFHATITRGGGFCCWRPLMLTLETDRKLNGEIFRYRLSVDGRMGPLHELKLYTMPVENSPRPEIFQSGILMQWGGNLSGNTAERFARLLARSGFNLFRINYSPDFFKFLRKYNIGTCENWNSIRDGYPQLGKKFNTTPFLDVEGKPFRNQLCPVEVYTRGAVYKKHIVPQVQRVMSSAAFFVVNWEVYHSDYKGCFCQRCMKEFVKFSKKSEAEIKAVWPRQVVSRYHDLWVKFRSQQHGKVCKVLEEDMASVRKGVHFMPMFSVTCFNEDSQYSNQYHPDDYLPSLKWINVWGPYLHSMGMNRPYEYIPGRSLQHYYGVRNVMEYFERHGGKHVNITGLPYGSHAFNVNTPEAAALELHNCFILGYKGAMFYWFHFDYRYWALAARANRMIAACENMVRVWGENNSVKAVPVTPIITDKHWKIHLGNCNYCPGMRTAKSAVITHAWSKGTSTLAAVGNFWEKGDLFFRLTVPGMKGNYVIRTPYAPYRYKFVTGAELAKGVLLHLPPLSWEYFLIEKREKKSYPGTPWNIEKKMALLKNDIQLKFADENRRLKEMERLFRITDYNFGETPEITAASVKVSETKWKNQQALMVKTPLYQALLAPADSGQIKSLAVGEKELVLQNNPSASFGKPGFWRPRARLVDNTPFRIFSIKAEKDHVTVVLERPRTMGFDLQIVWEFYEKSIKESFTVRNAGGRSEETVLRFHHMPMHLANHTGAHFSIGAQKFDIIGKDRTLICTPGVLGKSAHIKGGDTVFVSPAMGFDLIHHPLDTVQGYYLWNHPGTVTGSFEPIFKGRKLTPGETLTIRQFWKIGK